MSNKQTAVEWIISKLHLRLLTIESEPHGIVRETMLDNLLIDLEQAKAMEKEQIKDAFNEARLTNPMLGFKHLTFEEYYNETYGN